MMDLILTILSKVFTVTFFQKAVTQGVPLLFGATGEILTEKAGNLNLGIPGIMYMGAVGGLTGAFFYEQSTPEPSGAVGVLIAFLCAILFSAFGAFIYALLTITLRANQNVTGLALTTFGIGVGNFIGGSLSKIAGTAGQITVYTTGQAFRTTIPGLSQIPVVGPLLFSYGFLTYLSLALALFFAYLLARARCGLNLRAVGENPATADAAGINVIRYKYGFTILGGAVAGLGGLYFVMEYLGGTWQNNGFGDRGWLAIALVIFALWRPLRAIWGSFLFGGLYILFAYIPLGDAAQEILKMLPYLVTILVLVASSLRRRAEEQPPASLGLSYFREDR